MENYTSKYEAVFPLWCDVDILDAHDYREEVFEFSGLGESSALRGNGRFDSIFKPSVRV